VRTAGDDAIYRGAADIAATTRAGADVAVDESRSVDNYAPRGLSTILARNCSLPLKFL
jgi:hypothetical protein